MTEPTTTGPESIGQRLRRLRLERGLSQRELSSAGVSYAYISRIEAGARRPSVKALRQLSPKLGVDLIEKHGRQVEKADTLRAWARYLRKTGRESEALDVLDRAAQLSSSTPFQARA
jgi:transcriptional regulator with XRE-family HTH domain